MFVKLALIKNTVVERELCKENGYELDNCLVVAYDEDGAMQYATAEDVADGLACIASCVALVSNEYTTRAYVNEGAVVFSNDAFWVDEDEVDNLFA